MLNTSQRRDATTTGTHIMTTIANMIEIHNNIVNSNEFDDVKNIVKFSGSKAQLQERIDALNARVASLTTNDDDATTFRAADLARELNKNGKVLRAQIRRIRHLPDFPAHVNNVYSINDKSRLIAMLTKQD
jgi:hypothetical protein